MAYLHAVLIYIPLLDPRVHLMREVVMILAKQNYSISDPEFLALVTSLIRGNMYPVAQRMPPVLITEVDLLTHLIRANARMYDSTFHFEYQDYCNRGFDRTCLRFFSNTMGFHRSREGRSSRSKLTVVPLDEAEETDIKDLWGAREEGGSVVHSIAIA
ncbi:hypothetical protein cyc_05764 [Cyclospora cayetanensis]|uniref:Uncharacterized protein n=1 Tax=Cyclospora cayetanensis TaxID=88456 RepID=A0A1D3D108_9EIME|nr:hypothetical protein cyc_05764 [Cyclospora cayetanensis]